MKVICFYHFTSFHIIVNFQKLIPFTPFKEYVVSNKRGTFMDTKEIKTKSIEFWNEHFKNLQTFKIQKSDIVLDTALDECLKFIGDNCENVIDIGCGDGICLMEIALIGEGIKSGLGIDSSINAIKTAKEIVNLSKIDSIRFEVGDETALSKIKSQSYDGIFCSNFLDVIPANIGDKVIKEMKRIIKSKGYILLKFNFFLTPLLIEKLKMVEIEKNTYSMNGVIRAVNRSTEEWISLFEGFKVLKIDEFERVPSMPKDRLILLQNN